MTSFPRVLLLAILVLAPPALAQTPATEGFRVLNRTGQQATALYAVRSGRPDWGGNLLNRGPLGDGAGFILRPNAGAGCQFDLRMVLTDGRESVVRGQDVCTERQIALDPSTPRVPVAAAVPAPAAPRAPNAAPNAQARASSGTGFAIAADRVMTNHHVVDTCNRVLVRTPDGRMIAAVPPARVDAALDLAVLNVPGLGLPPLPFRSGPAVRRGEGVVVYGFPLAGLLSSDPKLTRGEINGLAGLGDNQAQYQVSAEVQPGNSGGPMLDMQGNLVGVVVSKLNAQNVARRTGDIAQNVNFAIRGSAALEFLRRASITPRLAESTGPDRSAPDVGDIAHRSTVFIRCER
ncbi:trypsin-like peptidase domain-containing protein [Humitalea sp. 24SJ18S-53]|uniref:trypsin-like peptidase domain-containing protein n=1 Tax=Humitalea sp. 24SJ18S-53 TaxID=3422307 RepID=UPI003D67F2FA